MKNIVIAETDRIGDVVLALPVFKSIKKHNKKIFITAFVKKYTSDIFINFPYVDDIISIPDNLNKKTMNNIILMLKMQQFDTALILHPEYNIAKIFKKSLIPNRISYGWKWYQFLFTKTIIQHRSKNKKHQVEYNLDIIKSIGINTLDTNIKLKPSNNNKFVRYLLKKENLLNKNIIGIHPGSGHSSLNLPAKQYVELISLIKRKFKNKVEIVITGGINDKNEINYIIDNCNEKIHILPINLPLSILIDIISKMKVFISNSTGPMHIASAIRTPVVAFFSPVFIHSPIRWGPYWGENLVIIPPVKCPGKMKCIKDRCPYYNCFFKLDFSSVLDFILNKIK